MEDESGSDDELEGIVSKAEEMVLLDGPTDEGKDVAPGIRVVSPNQVKRLLRMLCELVHIEIPACNIFYIVMGSKNSSLFSPVA